MFVSGHHTGSYRGHTTWDPRRHMYEELSVHPPGRGRLPPCPSSDENIYHRSGNTVFKLLYLSECFYCLVMYGVDLTKKKKTIFCYTYSKNPLQTEFL